MKKFVIATVVLLCMATTAFSGNFVRLIVPTLAELAGFTIKDGELSYDQSNEKLFVQKGGVSKQIIDEDSDVIYASNVMPTITIPKASTFASLSVHVSSGQVVLGKKLYKNNSSISCQFGNGDKVDGSGVGGYDMATEPSLPADHAVYLVPDPRVGFENNFNCILSDNLAAQRDTRFSNFIRVATYRLINFFTENGTHASLVSNNFVTKYLTPFTVSIFSISRNVNCVEISEISNAIASSISSAAVVIYGNAGAGGTVSYYSDSSCTNLIASNYSFSPGRVSSFIFQTSSKIYVSTTDHDFSGFTVDYIEYYEDKSGIQ